MAVTFPSPNLFPSTTTFPGNTGSVVVAPAVNITLTASLGRRRHTAAWLVLRRHSLGAPVSVVLPRESVELVGPISAAVDGVAVTTFEVALIAAGTRPVTADWTAPVVVTGLRYLLVGPGTTRPLAVGTFQLWVRHTSIPETPVLDNAGTVVVT